ncbi:MAG: hypothetical protein WC756_21585 [Taibaiella sp.]|jgi:hypothetical protein
MKTYANGDAFPTISGQSLGLTKREYFAAMAMGGMSDSQYTYERIAEMSVSQADALIKELNKTQEKI